MSLTFESMACIRATLNSKGQQQQDKERKRGEVKCGNEYLPINLVWSSILKSWQPTFFSLSLLAPLSRIEGRQEGWMGGETRSVDVQHLLPSSLWAAMQC